MLNNVTSYIPSYLETVRCHILFSLGLTYEASVCITFLETAYNLISHVVRFPEYFNCNAIVF